MNLSKEYEIQLTDYSRNKVAVAAAAAGGGRRATDRTSRYVISALVPHNKLLTGRVT